VRIFLLWEDFQPKPDVIDARYHRSMPRFRPFFPKDAISLPLSLPCSQVQLSRLVMLRTVADMYVLYCSSWSQFLRTPLPLAAPLSWSCC
jgi:hypothetical protein